MTITINGTTGIAGVDGSAGTPAVQGTDTNTGVFFGTDTVTIATGGTAAVTVDSGQRTKFPTTIGVGAATPAASGAGITFPATASASSDANTLDDYEEGTWTATMTCGTSGTITMNDNTGKYTKVGRLVNISGFFSVTSVSSPTGRLNLNGLPFTQVPDGRPVGIVYLLTTNAFTGVPWCIGNEVTSINIDRNAGTGADPATDLASAIKANTEFYINFTYITT